jgi:hypothetical protein
MSTSRHRNLLVLAPLALASAIVLCSVAPMTVGDGVAVAQPKDKKRKLTKRQWKKKMNGWSRQIGKKCVYCHVKEGDEFDYEAKTPKKAIAHYCEEQFVDQLLTKSKKPVTCATCHNKKPLFLPREANEASDDEKK